MNNQTTYDCGYFKIYEVCNENRKTPILYIVNKEEINLGVIKWYGAWRKFCFFPANETIWDNKCLSQILNFIEQYNKNWKNKRK